MRLMLHPPFRKVADGGLLRLSCMFFLEEASEAEQAKSVRDFLEWCRPLWAESE